MNSFGISKGPACFRKRYLLLWILFGLTAMTVASAAVIRHLIVDEQYLYDDSYHVYAPGSRLDWRHKPNVSFTLEQLLAERRAQGRDRSVSHLESSHQRLGYGLTDTVFSINSEGFKGPEIDPKHLRPRIIMIGDSCTFGSAFDKFAYPRVVERVLKDRGLDWEVINAGVEGYSPYNALREMPRYLELKPQVATIFIGWNAIYRTSLDVEEKSEVRLESPFAQIWRLFQDGLYSLLMGQHRYAQWQLSKERLPDKNAPGLAQLEKYWPPSIGDIAAMVRQFQAAGTKVVLMTLPGMYVMDEEPTPLALSKGHLPSYTQNPYLLAKVTERFNKELIAVAKAYHTQLIDLDLWSREALAPRDQIFLDGVHVVEEAQVKEGVFIASELAPLLSTVQNAG